MFNPEFADNPEPRCPCMVLVDVSNSMEGEPNRELNRGLATMSQALKHDPVASLRVETAVISFGGKVKLECPFTTMDDFVPPQLKTHGGTPMGEALMKGLDEIEKRKANYRANGIPYYRPWMILITDGEPTDTWHDAAQAIHEAEARKKILFFAVGVEGADMETLRQIAPPNRPPVKLQGLEFSKLFQWVSASMAAVGHSQVGDQVALPAIDSWAVVDNE